MKNYRFNVINENYTLSGTGKNYHDLVLNSAMFTKLTTKQIILKPILNAWMEMKISRQKRKGRTRKSSKTFELNEEKTTHINFLMETIQTPLSPNFIPITISTKNKQNKTHTYIPITV